MSHLKRFKYNSLRKERLLNSISSTDISKDTSLYFISIKGTLNHIYFGELLWLMRIKGILSLETNHPHKEIYEYKQLCKYWCSDNRNLFKDIFNENDPVYLKNHIQRMKEIDELYIEHINKFDQNQIQNEECKYKDTCDVDSKICLEDALFHVVNHTTHHIGQITAVLPKNDKYPELDYTYLI